MVVAKKHQLSGSSRRWRRKRGRILPTPSQQSPASRRACTRRGTSEAGPATARRQRWEPTTPPRCAPRRSQSPASPQRTSQSSSTSGSPPELSRNYYFSANNLRRFRDDFSTCEETLLQIALLTNEVAPALPCGRPCGRRARRRWWWRRPTLPGPTRLRWSSICEKGEQKGEKASR